MSRIMRKYDSSVRWESRSESESPQHQLHLRARCHRKDIAVEMDGTPPVPPQIDPVRIDIRIASAFCTLSSPVRKRKNGGVKRKIRNKREALKTLRFQGFSGRSAGTRTPGLLLPKQARYQLRNTPKSAGAPKARNRSCGTHRTGPSSSGPDEISAAVSLHSAKIGERTVFYSIIYFKSDCKCSVGYGKINFRFRTMR